MTGPRFQPQIPALPARVLDMSLELRVDRIVAGRKTSFTVDHGSHFLPVNFLLWPYSRLRTRHQGGLWSSLKAKNQPSITLSIWKISPHTLIPHIAQVLNGIPRETSIIQIGSLYYHTPPSIQSLYSACRWHLDSPYASPLTFPWIYPP